MSYKKAISFVLLFCLFFTLSGENYLFALRPPAGVSKESFSQKLRAYFGAIFKPKQQTGKTGVQDSASVIEKEPHDAATSAAWDFFQQLNLPGPFAQRVSLSPNSEILFVEYDTERWYSDLSYGRLLDKLNDKNHIQKLLEVKEFAFIDLTTKRELKDLAKMVGSRVDHVSWLTADLIRVTYENDQPAKIFNVMTSKRREDLEKHVGA